MRPSWPVDLLRWCPPPARPMSVSSPHWHRWSAWPIYSSATATMKAITLYWLISRACTHCRSERAIKPTRCVATNRPTDLGKFRRLKRAPARRLRRCERANPCYRERSAAARHGSSSIMGIIGSWWDDRGVKQPRKRLDTPVCSRGGIAGQDGPVAFELEPRDFRSDQVPIVDLRARAICRP